jgi:hypothetical protein
LNATDELPTKWQRLNRSGGSLFSLLILFGISLFAHFLAHSKLGMIALDDRAAGEARLIDFVQRHLWIVPVYFCFLLTVWIWLSLRNAGRLIMFVSLILLSAPVLFYDRACLHISNKLLSGELFENEYGTNQTTNKE